jgi:hypothetical protein
MSKFVPRHITADQAAQGYNNEGRGELMGYIAYPDQHEDTCAYRISTGGDWNKQPHEACTCRIGLWRERGAQEVVNEMRKTMPRTSIPKTDKSSRDPMLAMG